MHASVSISSLVGIILSCSGAEEVGFSFPGSSASYTKTKKEGIKVASPGPPGKPPTLPLTQDDFCVKFRAKTGVLGVVAVPSLRFLGQSGCQEPFLSGTLLTLCRK